MSLLIQVSSRSGRGAAFGNDCGKIPVDCHDESSLFHRAAQPLGNVKTLPRFGADGKRYQRPHLWVIEIDRVAAGTIRHRKNAKRIGLDQGFRGKCVAFGHGSARLFRC